MPRRKLERFALNDENPHIIQEGKTLYTKIKGRWNEDFFQNDRPIVVELACGRGEYTVGLAEVFPQKNFVGVDIKGSRIWSGGSEALEKDLKNVAFLRTYIQNLGLFFDEGEVSEIWITFPDPRPKGRDERRRLTHPRFLEMYRQLTGPDSTLHLKTDNDDFFDYTLEVLETYPHKELRHTRDLYRSEYAQMHHGIQTRYEKIFTQKGFSVKYLQFQFSGASFLQVREEV